MSSSCDDSAQLRDLPHLPLQFHPDPRPPDRRSYREMASRTACCGSEGPSHWVCSLRDGTVRNRGSIRRRGPGGNQHTRSLGYRLRLRVQTRWTTPLVASPRDRCADIERLLRVRQCLKQKYRRGTEIAARRPPERGAIRPRPGPLPERGSSSPRCCWDREHSFSQTPGGWGSCGTDAGRKASKTITTEQITARCCAGPITSWVKRRLYTKPALTPMGAVDGSRLRLCKRTGSIGSSPQSGSRLSWNVPKGPAPMRSTDRSPVVVRARVVTLEHGDFIAHESVQVCKVCCRQASEDPW